MIEGIWEVGSGQRNWMCQLRGSLLGEQREVHDTMLVKYLLLT